MFVLVSVPPFSCGDCDCRHVGQLKRAWKGEDRRGVFLKLGRKFVLEEAHFDFGIHITCYTVVNDSIKYCYSPSYPILLLTSSLFISPYS